MAKTPDVRAQNVRFVAFLQAWYFESLRVQRWFDPDWSRKNPKSTTQGHLLRDYIYQNPAISCHFRPLSTPS
jgi:hypothetical protein